MEAEIIKNLTIIQNALDFYQEFNADLLFKRQSDYVLAGKLSENIKKCIKDLKKE